MPELPEVETIRSGLSEHILGQTVQRVSIYSPKLRYPVDLNPEQLQGQKIQSVNRRGKYLLFTLERQQILCHLGMSGRLWLIKNDQAKRQKHDHVDIQLETHCLRYHDPRRFGLLLTINPGEQHVLLKNLGPEPLTHDFNTRYLQKILARRQTAIKQVIMNNHIVVGVGNIYANEALFRAGIHPMIACDTLSEKEIQSLVSEIKKTLKSAIKSGGTTLKDFTDIRSQPGYFSQKLLVYGRHGKPCLRCNHTLEFIQQQGRRSFYCGVCQLFRSS